MVNAGDRSEHAAQGTTTLTVRVLILSVGPPRLLAGFAGVAAEHAAYAVSEIVQNAQENVQRRWWAVASRKLFVDDVAGSDAIYGPC